MRCTSSIVNLLSIWFLCGISYGFNITHELEGNPKYSDFNNVLTKSGLAKSINGRTSLTVCALTNSQMSVLKNTLGTGASDIKKIAALVRPMILLNFIDPSNPNTAKGINGSREVASMYQAAGAAPEVEGIANLTKTRKGKLVIVAAGGSNATITKSVKKIGYTLSIVEISNPLLPTGVVGSENATPVADGIATPPPPPPPVKSKASDDDPSDDEDSPTPNKSGVSTAGVPAALLTAAYALCMFL